MLTRPNRWRWGAAWVTLVLAALPRVAAATPGPDDRKSVEARGGAVPRDSPGLVFGAKPRLGLPLEAFFEAASRGAQQPRGGVEYLMAREQGPGPALQSVWLVPSHVVDQGGVNADEVPLDTVTRGAVMPLQAGEQGAWKGEGVGPTGTDLP